MGHQALGVIGAIAVGIALAVSFLFVTLVDAGRRAADPPRGATRATGWRWALLTSSFLAGVGATALLVHLTEQLFLALPSLVH